MYQYDSLGQVISGRKYFSDNTPVPGQQFGYGFDDIGNRQQTTAGGDASGNGLRKANYTANNLNQITARDYPGTNDVIGAALATNGVTVNGAAADRHGEYFHRQIGVANTNQPVWQPVDWAPGVVSYVDDWLLQDFTTGDFYSGSESGAR